MESRKLRQLQDGTYDHPSSNFVPLKNIILSSKDFRHSRDSDSDCEYFYHANSEHEASAALRVSDQNIAEDGESITALAFGGEIFHFNTARLQQADVILAAIAESSTKASHREKLKKNSLIMKEPQNKLAALPSIFKEFMPKAIRVFQAWIEKSRYDTKSIMSTKEDYYSLKLQATCIMLGYTWGSSKFVGLATEEANHAFLGRDARHVSITIRDVQLCHAVAPLLNPVLVSLLKQYDATRNESFKSLRYSHDVVHPSSWVEIESASDTASSTKPRKYEPQSSVDEEDLGGASEQGFQAARSPSNYGPVSQDGDRTTAEMGTGSNTSREPSIAGPAPTSGVSTPTEQSTVPTSPASGVDSQEEKSRDGADGADGGASAFQSSRNSNEPDTIIALPSSLQATEPSTSTLATPGLPDWSSDIVSEGGLLESRSSQEPQAPEVRSSQAVSPVPGNESGNDKTKLVTTSECETPVEYDVDTPLPDWTTTADDGLVKKLLTRRKHKTFEDSSKFQSVSPKVLGKWSVETKSQPTVVGAVQTGGSGQTRPRKSATFKAKQQSSPEYVIDLGDLSSNDFQSRKDPGMFVEQENIGSGAGGQGIKRVASAGAISNRATKSSKESKLPAATESNPNLSRAMAKQIGTEKYGHLFLPTQQYMGRPVDNSAPMQMARASKGPVTILREIANFPTPKTLPGSGRLSRKQKEEIEDKYAADISRMQQRQKKEKERERRASLG